MACVPHFTDAATSRSIVSGFSATACPAEPNPPTSTVAPSGDAGHGFGRLVENRDPAHDELLTRLLREGDIGRVHCERRYFDAHVREQRQVPQQLMQLVVVGNVEDAEV